jgi:hypothetical protein
MRSTRAGVPWLWAVYGAVLVLAVALDGGAAELRIITPAPFSFHTAQPEFELVFEAASARVCELVVHFDGARVGTGAVEIGNRVETVALSLTNAAAGQHFLALSCDRASTNVSFTLLPPSHVHAMLPERLGQQIRAPVMNMIAFSKDRASQLDLLLRSLKEFVAGWRAQRLLVLFCASTPAFAAGYDRVRAYHRDVEFTAERSTDCTGMGTSFKQQLVGALSSGGALPFTMFMVDDMIFKSGFDPEGLDMQVFAGDATVLSLALRLHPHVSHGISGPRMEHIPAHFAHRPRLGLGNNPEERKWNWVSVAHGDYAYPMSLNGHIFRNADILRVLPSAFFHNPNLLEAALSRAAPQLAAALGRTRMMAPLVGIVVNIPANVVQSTYLNDNMGVPAAWFNGRFLAGARLTMHHLRGVHTTSGQSELPLVFHPSSAPVVDLASLRADWVFNITSVSCAANNGEGGSTANTRNVDPEVPEEHHAACTDSSSSAVWATAIFSWSSNDPIASLFPAHEWCNKIVSLDDGFSVCLSDHRNCVRVVVPGCFASGDKDRQRADGKTIAVLVNDAIEHGRAAALRADITLAWITTQPAAKRWLLAQTDTPPAFDAVFSSTTSLLNSADARTPSSVAAVNFLPAGVARVPKSLWRIHDKSKNVMLRANFADAPWERETNVLWDTLVALNEEVDVDFIDSRLQMSEENSYRFSILLGGNDALAFNSDVLHCFLTGTIPIVRASAALAASFNVNGIILYDSLYELIDIVKYTANEDLYDDMAVAISSNLAIAKQLMHPFRSMFLWAANLVVSVPRAPLTNPPKARDTIDKVDVVLIASAGSSACWLNRSLRSVLGQQDVSLRVAVVIEDGSDDAARLAVHATECGAAAGRCFVTRRGTASKHRNSDHGLGHLMLDALHSLGVVIDQPLARPNAAIGGSVVVVMDARDKLLSPHALSDVAVALGCGGTGTSPPRDGDVSGDFRPQLTPWLTWLCAREGVECEEPVSIAFRGDLLRFVLRETLAPEAAGKDSYRGLSMRLFAVMKILAGDRVTGRGDTAATHFAAHAPPSAAAALEDAAPSPPFDMAVEFNTRAAAQISDAIPLRELGPRHYGMNGSAAASYRRLVEYGARRHCARDGSHGTTSARCRPLMAISAPRKGNYFAQGSGKVIVDLPNFWIPEEGSLAIEIDGVQVHSLSEMGSVSGRVEFHLSSVGQLSVGYHSMTVRLISTSGEVVDAETVEFGVM